MLNGNPLHCTSLLCVMLSLPWCCYRLLSLFKDAVYSVGLGEQGSITKAHSQSQKNPSQRTYTHIRCGNHQESDGVTQEDSCQQHIAHLSSWCSNNGSVIVADKCYDDKRRGNNSQHGDEHRDNGPRWVPLQFDNGNGDAAGSVHVWSHLVRTQLACEFRCLGKSLLDVIFRFQCNWSWDNRSDMKDNSSLI